MKRAGRSAGAAFCVLTALSGSALAQNASISVAAEDGLHIGVLAPLSGPFERLGRQVERGVILALEEARRTDVRVTAVDDACDEDRGRDAANQLLGAQVDIVVGGVCWRPALAARDVLATQDVPMITSGVRYPGLTDDALSPVLRVNGRDDAQASLIVESLVSGAFDGLVGGSAVRRPLVLLYTEGSYGRPLADAVQEGLNAEGVTLALFEPFEAEGGIARAAARAEAEGPGLVLVMAGQADSALLINALRQAMPDVPVLAGDSVMTADFSLLASQSAENVVFPRPTPWRLLAPMDDVARLEGEALGSLSGLIVPSMVAAEIALAIAAGQGTGPYLTIIGAVRFDEIGDADVPSFQFWQWRDGTIWPFEPMDREGAEAG